VGVEIDIIKPPPEMINAISQEFYSWELSENDDSMTSINLQAEEDSNKSYVD
jgi:hypothetical protein